MITLDQIKQLDVKVRKAIDIINSQKSENNMLQEKLDTYQLRIEELEILIDTFKEDQGEIEHGIIDALNQLDILEESTVVPEESLQEEQAASETTEEPGASEPDIDTEKKDTEDETSLESENETVQESANIDEEEKTEETTADSSDSEIELDIF